MKASSERRYATGSRQRNVERDPGVAVVRGGEFDEPRRGV
jgi:hypothetical protein